MPKLRVGVLMGGKGIEKEVSFNSGRTICDLLDTARYEIIPLFQTQSNLLYVLPWHFLHRGKISDFEHRLSSEAQNIAWDDLKQLIDFIYIAMHGRFAEDGTLQGFLQVLSIPYLGSKVLGSALGMDKIMQKEILQIHSIKVPQSITLHPDHILNYELHKQNILQQLEKNSISFPCIVKPYQEGSSFGISIVHTHDDLHSALLKACHTDGTRTQKVLIEEKIIGMEFTCITITDYHTGEIHALPPTEIVADAHKEIFDYEQKYMPGAATEFTPARCCPKDLKRIQETCIQAMAALHMSNLARIDGFLTHDGSIIIIDPNSLSGMAPTSFLFREAAYHNMSHTKLINHLIETELQSYGMLNAIIAHEQKEGKGVETKKLKVGILMGGRSNEREISLESGRNITYKLSPQKYEALPLFVSSEMELFPLSQRLLVLNSTSQIESAIDITTKIKWNDLPQLVDFVFIGLHGGEGENGSVQGTLEMLGIPYNGSSVLASALCMDKFKTNQFLKAKGFDVPLGLLIEKYEWQKNNSEIINKIATALPLPLIVKPHDDGCSVMVQKVKKLEDLATALEHIFTTKEYALVEECISGMELTVGVIGNDEARALPPSQAVCASEILSIEEKFLPGAGENQTPAPLPAETLLMVQKTIERAYQTLGCKGYARIDCFYQTDQQSPSNTERVVILEVNTLPGMTPATCIFHQAAEVGIKPMDFIDMIITLGLQEHASHTFKAQSEATTINLTSP